MCAKLTSRRSSKPEGVQQSNGGPWSLQVLLLHAVREITIPIRGGRRLAAFDILFGRLQHRGPTPVSCAGPSFKSCLAPTSFWIPPHRTYCLSPCAFLLTSSIVKNFCRLYLASTLVQLFGAPATRSNLLLLGYPFTASLDLYFQDN